MQWIKLVAGALLLGAVVWIGNSYRPFGSSLPPMGRLLSPFEGFWQQAEPADGPADQEWVMDALEQPVHVYFDDRMVPHLFAANPGDLFFVQGYLSACFRLWQMELTARNTSGRLSEVLGEVALDHDKTQRRLGLARSAREVLKAWQTNEGEFSLLEAYSAGVNAYLAQLRPASFPLEYKLLAIEPEAWSPLHSAWVYKSMVQTLNQRNKDVEATNTLRLLGEETFDFLFPEHNPRQSPVIPSSVDWPFEPLTVRLPDSLFPAQLSFQHDLLEQPPRFAGSNNWAISGEKTQSGRPLLANDPHLPLFLPSIWQEFHLHCPQFNAYGVTVPGLPGIIIGFNEQVAWGMTNVGQDVLDWYRIDWVDKKGLIYWLDGQHRKATVSVDTFRVRGRSEPMLDTLVHTHWGPLIYEDKEDPRQDLAMHWIANEPTPEKPFYELGTFLRFMKAESVDELSKALIGFDNPAQNFVFADRAGTIAQFVNGRFPLKYEEQGRYVQDGRATANGWQGYIPQEHKPRVINPARGFVASANQRSTAPDYPYYYNGRFDDYRGRYINDRLDTATAWTAREVMELQLDNHSLFAVEAVPLLLARLDTGNLSLAQIEFLEFFRQWDHSFDASDQMPIFFEEWYQRCFRRTFDELYEASEYGTVLFPEKWRFLELLASQNDHPIFDVAETQQLENADSVVSWAFREAFRDWWKPLLSEEWHWSRYNNLEIKHLLRIRAFSTGEVNTGGYSQAPNAVRSGHGPSWRMVVELGDPPQAWGVFPGGASGNPGSPFYASQVRDWASGRYYRLRFPATFSDLAPTALAFWQFKSSEK